MVRVSQAMTFAIDKVWARPLLFRFLTAAKIIAVMVPMLTWNHKKSLPEGLSGGAVSFISNHLVYAGGTTWRDGQKNWLAETIVYDPQTNDWSRGPTLPEPLAYGARVATDSSLEVLGGANATGISRHCWRLDRSLEKWTACGELPMGSIFGTAENVFGSVLLFGGCDDAELHRCNANVLRRKPGGDWEKVSELPDGAVLLAASAVAKGSVYLFGGYVSDAHGNRDRALRYDVKSNRWTTLKALPRASRGMCAAAIDEQHILLTGGYTNSATGFSADAYVYDIARDEYVQITPLPVALLGAALVRHADSVWMLGGEDKPRHRTSDVFQAIVSGLVNQSMSKKTP